MSDHEPYGFTQEREEYDKYSRRASWLPVAKNGCLRFGKYHGFTVSEMSSHDPAYFKWACGCIPRFKELAEFYLKNQIKKPRTAKRRNGRKPRRRD